MIPSQSMKIARATFRLELFIGLVYL